MLIESAKTTKKSTKSKTTTLWTTTSKFWCSCIKQTGSKSSSTRCASKWCWSNQPEWTIQIIYRTRKLRSRTSQTLSLLDVHYTSKDTLKMPLSASSNSSIPKKKHCTTSLDLTLEPVSSRWPSLSKLWSNFKLCLTSRKLPQILIKPSKRDQHSESLKVETEDFTSTRLFVNFKWVCLTKQLPLARPTSSQSKLHRANYYNLKSKPSSRKKMMKYLRSQPSTSSSKRGRSKRPWSKRSLTDLKSNGQCSRTACPTPSYSVPSLSQTSPPKGPVPKSKRHPRCLKDVLSKLSTTKSPLRWTTATRIDQRTTTIWLSKTRPTNPSHLNRPRVGSVCEVDRIWALLISCSNRGRN